MRVYVPGMAVEVGVNCSALGICVAEDVTEHGDCAQVKPVGAVPVMVTGEANPLEGVMVKE